MTLTLPGIVNSNYAGTSADFRNVKRSTNGSLRAEYFTVSIPGVTVITTIVGLVPFQKGFRFHTAASFISVADLDSGSSVTLDIGYTYYDSTLGTTVDDAWADSSTAPQAGGAITLVQTTETNVATWVAAADGWITATVNVQTTTTGNIYGQIVGSYDIGG